MKNERTDPADTRADRRDEAARPTLRDKSMAYAVKFLFGNRFEVEGNGRRYYPECVFIGGDFIARCTCPDKLINKAAQCKHEVATVRFERARVARMQGL